MPSRALLAPGLAAAALVVTLIVVSGAPAPLIGSLEQTAPINQRLRPVVVTPHKGLKARPELSPFPTWLVVVLTSMLLLFVLAVLIFVALSTWRRRNERPVPRVEEDEPASPVGWHALLAAELAAAADQARADLSQGNPRNAIVACWMRLQRVAQTAGLSPVASETSEEFTVRALASLSLDRTAAQTLGRLYREARFSDHEMLESQRDTAQQALGVLARQLDRPDAAMAAR